MYLSFGEWEPRDPGEKLEWTGVRGSFKPTQEAVSMVETRESGSKAERNGQGAADPSSPVLLAWAPLARPESP